MSQFVSFENEALIDQRLGRYERYGVDLGLTTIQKLLSALGNPQNRVPIVHVAGTNGKGSVCAYLSSVLCAAGYQVGRYTSPHLLSWRERICLNNEPISATDLLQTLDQVEAATALSGTLPTQFEVLTAAAWQYFAEQAVDIAVIEVGLGGRLDATNVVDQPLVSVITSISRDHWQRLGPTLADIAWEKAGILKPHRPAVLGPLLTVADTVISDRARQLACPIIRPSPAHIDTGGYAVYHPPEEAPGTPCRYELPFSGLHQLANSAIAIATLHWLRRRGWHIPDDAIQQGIAKARWPGRLQWVTWPATGAAKAPLLIDGAHNSAAAEVLRTYVDTLMQSTLPPLEKNRLIQGGIVLPISGAVTWIIGMLATKDHRDILQALLRPGDRLYALPVPGHAGLPPEALIQIALSVCPQLSEYQTLSNFEAVLPLAMSTPSSLRILCGSLYLVGDFFRTQNFSELPPP